MRQVVLKVHHIPVPDLIQIGKMVCSKMIENAGIFPNPPVSLTKLNEEIERLELLQQEMISRNYGKKLERDACVETVAQHLKNLTSYVQTIANGSETIASMAGMYFKRPPTRVKEVTPIELISVEWLKELMALRIMVKKNRTHRGIIVQLNYDLPGGGEWKEAGIYSEWNIRVHDVQRGAMVWVRARAIATGGRMTDWTPPVSTRVG
jgi:hypothetical protein